MEPVTPTALKKLRVVDLKEKLSFLGLPLNGLKADLIGRLLDYYSSQAQIQEESTFNVVQQPSPPSLPTVQPTIGQPGLVHGESSYSSNQTQHQLQLDSHIQHTSPSPSSISIQPCFASTHMPQDELPTNFPSQVNSLSSPNQLSPRQHTHQSYQSHKEHQEHHHYHEPSSSLVHPTPSVIESSHIKMSSDDSTNYFDNSSHNLRQSSQSLNQPLQSTSPIDLSSQITFIQEKSNSMDCQAINQSQSSVSVDTLPIKHSDLPAFSIDQTQNPIINEEPGDGQLHETPQKAIFDLENLLHEALKANQPTNLGATEPCQDDENVSEHTSPTNEDFLSVTDMDAKAIETREKTESTPEPEACLENEQLKVEIQVKSEQCLDDQKVPSLVATEEKNQNTETGEETFIEASADRPVDVESSVTDNKLEQDNSDMETSYDTQQSPVDTIELETEANQSQINQIKTTNETENVPIQSDTDIIFNQTQSDTLSALEANDYSSSVVKEQPADNQLSQEDNEERGLSNIDIERINDPLDTLVIPSVNETKLTVKIDAESKRKLTRNDKKKLRKKKKKIEKSKVSKENEKPLEIDDDDDIEIEYVEDEVIQDPIYFQYVKIFEKFKGSDVTNSEPNEDYSDIIDPGKKTHERKKPVELELKEEDDEKNDGEPKISKRKLKQLTRMTVANLKQKVSHPELVEMHDVTAKDPLLLLNLKSTRNSVPVPRHWCFKRKYLQGKRGFEKPPFKLPEFIRKTGIMEMRQALQEKEDAKSLKTKQREKIRPKLGKIDIDYQKLHDAFFKWATKPRMTVHGDIYYEGKEFETKLKEKKAGDLSVDLRVALGMPTGPNAHKCPPPWLIAMQRYGPPPSYPNLKIPGLNARIPDGCSFGFHAGGWGKPPVDEYGRPLYGDVFGLSSTQDRTNAEEDVDQSLWGEMESEEEEEEEEEDDDDNETRDQEKPGREADESGIATPSEGLATPSGFASISTGMETPDIIELRKRKIEAEMESNDNPALYTIIPEKKNDGIGKEMMGSTHVYDVSGSILKKGQGIEVALDPNDLELPVAGLTAKYEQTLKEQQAHLAKEDLSDMVAEHAARQKRKKTQDTSKTNKKYKDFKF